ncbi:MAG: thermonuclease family protein [Pseudomonadota bacterium]
MTIHSRQPKTETCTVLHPSANGILRKAAVIFFCALVMILATLTLAESAPQVRRGVVNRVVDGDTVWISSDGILLKVRIAGIDAPEICQSYGLVARHALQRRVLGQVVTITHQRLDDYGRLLSRVDVGDEDLGRWLVLQGHAWSYGYRDQPGPYAREQQAASTARLGIFALGAPEIPRDFRKRHGSCFPRLPGKPITDSNAK